MELTIEQILNIRFSDTDAMGVVWHGNYIRFFEDGREAFGDQYDLKYLDIYARGYFAPIVSMEIKHKAPIYYGDQAKLITKFIPQRAAKMTFEYEIVNLNTNAVCAVGKSVQVFLRAHDRQLELNSPEFYIDWKKKLSLD